MKERRDAVFPVTRACVRVCVHACEKRKDGEKGEVKKDCESLKGGKCQKGGILE